MYAIYHVFYIQYVPCNPSITNFRFTCTAWTFKSCQVSALHAAPPLLQFLRPPGPEKKIGSWQLWHRWKCRSLFATWRAWGPMVHNPPPSDVDAWWPKLCQMVWLSREEVNCVLLHHAFLIALRLCGNRSHRVTTMLGKSKRLEGWINKSCRTFVSVFVCMYSVYTLLDIAYSISCVISISKHFCWYSANWVQFHAQNIPVTKIYFNHCLLWDWQHA